MTSFLNHVQHFLLGKPSKDPPYFLKLRSSTGFIVTTVCLAIFTDIFFYGLIVPVIPFSLTVQVGTPGKDVQRWTAILLACYSVALFVLSPIAGYYADRTNSRRLPLLIGLVALAGSTVLLCVGKTMTLLVIGRIAQGFSAAIVWSVGLALLADTVGNKIGVSMGWVSISMSIGLIISPVIGGAVYEAAGYYTVYYIAFAIIFVDIVLRLLLVERKVARQWESAEPEAAMDALPSDEEQKCKNAITRGSQARKDGHEATPDNAQPRNGTPHGEQGEAAGVDEAQTATSPKKIHPLLALVKSKRLLAALYGIVVQAGLMMAGDTILPLFVKDVFGWDSTAAGLAFLCLFVPGFISPAVGWLSDRYGPTIPSVLGFAASVPVLVCLRFVANNTVAHKVLLCVLLVLLGVTLAFANVPLMAEISYVIEDKEARNPGVFGERGVYGIAYGLFTTFFALGGTVGSLFAGYMVAGPGWGTTTWVLSLWCATGGVAVAIWVGGGLKDGRRRPKDPSTGESSPDRDSEKGNPA